MSTWNAITIQEPGALTLETLPEALTPDGEIWEGYDAYDERVSIPEHQTSYGSTMPAYEGKPDGSIIIEGGSKYRADDAISALIELSKATGRITHYQQWDDDDGGQETTVWENGEYIKEASSHDMIVPDNLPDLLVAGRRALQNSLTAATEEQQDALRAILDALAPEKESNA